MDSIGGYKSFSYSYNDHEFKNEDTVKYSITIQGNRKKITYLGRQQKNGDQWELIDEQLMIE
jgi:hypothetical protein